MINCIKKYHSSCERKLLLPFKNGIRYWQISMIAMISIERVVIVIIS